MKQSAAMAMAQRQARQRALRGMTRHSRKWAPGAGYTGAPSAAANHGHQAAAAAVGVTGSEAAATAEGSNGLADCNRDGLADWPGSSHGQQSAPVHSAEAFAQLQAQLGEFMTL